MFLAGCAPSDDAPLITFGQGTAIGTWRMGGAGTAGMAVRVPPPPPAAAAGTASAPIAPRAEPTVPPVVPAPPVGALGGAVAPVLPSAGNAAPPPASTHAGTGAPAAGSGGQMGSAGSAPAAGGKVTSLTFDVTTTPVGGRYQPRNVGAIWIEDSSGKLVKSLQVWAGIRRIWLTRYGSVLGFSPVDVTATATLSSHKAHHVTWDLKDTTGAMVPPGKYTLMMELTDSDASGRTNMLPVDTSAGPQMMMPPNAPSFTMMTLQLQ